MNAQLDAQLEEILGVLLGIARQDFTVRARVGSAHDSLDAIAVGLNMLAEELQSEVASRRELELAHQELKQAEARLIHAGKLAAIGQLASGVAHEINNPAMALEAAIAIIGIAFDQARARARVTMPEGWIPDATIKAVDMALQDAGEALDRIRRLTGDLRTFARADDEVLRPVQLDEVIRISCRLAESTVRPRAELVVDLQPVPTVLGSRGRLGQVVTNLLVNAAQAMLESAREQNVIVVSTRVAGDEVLLSIEDSGPGIPVDLRKKIFEPFFTTKPEGVGTGLGLSLVAEIVRAHRGRIEVSTGVRGGARFEIHLPAHRMPVIEPAPRPRSSAPMYARLLLVDDEPMILRLFTNLLADASLEVLTAKGGAEAIALLEQDQAFHAILCDLQMPGVDGILVYEAVERIAPALVARFVFTTGGAITMRGRDFLDRVRPRVLAKPFRIDELFALLEEMQAHA
jgi:signal transduction histidine kinase/CheY-like chemotaxis protein